MNRENGNPGTIKQDYANRRDGFNGGGWWGGEGEGRALGAAASAVGDRGFAWY